MFIKHNLLCQKQEEIHKTITVISITLKYH